MNNKCVKRVALFIVMIVVLQVKDAFPKNYPYKVMNIQKISRYNEDRLAYQHIERKDKEYELGATDNSIATLLVIRDRRMYMFMDGYDNPKNVRTRSLILEMENSLIPDLWANKLDNLPDFMTVTDRRVEIQRKTAAGSKAGGDKAKSKSLGGKFDSLYKNIRDKLILKHIQIFKTLMINRRESGLYIVRTPLPKRVYDTGPTKYFTSATGKTIDGKHYYAEDADGDGITETFMVNIPDGFHWGYKSGPNIIFIHNNRQEELTKLIGKLASSAYFGTDEEAKIIEKQFFKEDEINDMIEDIYRMNPDQEKLLKTQ